MSEVAIDQTVLNHAKRTRENRARLQILVVEDDEFSRGLVTRTLKEYDILEAENGEEALKSYTLNAPNLLFLDVELPDFNGDIILKEVMKADPDAFVVMLTSHTEAEFVKEAVATGVKGYVAKPFNKERILKYVEQCKSEKEG